MENFLVVIILAVFAVLLVRAVRKSKTPTNPVIGGGGYVDTDTDTDKGDDVIKIDRGTSEQ